MFQHLKTFLYSNSIINTVSFPQELGIIPKTYPVSLAFSWLGGTWLFLETCGRHES